MIWVNSLKIFTPKGKFTNCLIVSKHALKKILGQNFKDT